MNALAQVRQVSVLARRVDAATPPQRDRAVDALRALAIAGVIGGHWLVTALVLGGSRGHTVLSDNSPLASMPALTPLSWIFQTLAVFFLAGGAAATAALIAWAGYPASMVGVNGAHISNLNPPTLAAVSFGIAQCGLALLLRDRLARLMRRPLAWAGIALVNLSAMTLFLWHQTAFVTVSSLGLLVGRVPGLLTAPTGGLWVAERLVWLPVFAIMLSGLWLAFRRVERG